MQHIIYAARLDIPSFLFSFIVIFRIYLYEFI